MKLTLNGNCKEMAEPLRADGHDVEVADEPPGGDIEIQRRAQNAGRIVVTTDKDWLDPEMHRIRTGGCIVIENTPPQGRLRQTRAVIEANEEELLQGTGFRTRDVAVPGRSKVTIRPIKQSMPERNPGEKDRERRASGRGTAAGGNTRNE